MKPSQAFKKCLCLMSSSDAQPHRTIQTSFLSFSASGGLTVKKPQHGTVSGNYKPAHPILTKNTHSFSKF